MKSIFNNKILKYLTCFMVLLQGVLFSFVATFYMDIVYFRKLSMYPKSATYIELKNIPEEKIEAAYSFLKEYAEKNALFYLRKDYLLDKTGAVNGALFSVGGDVQKNKEKLNLDFLGRKIIDFAKLESLFASKDENATLGVYQSSLNSIGDIPHFKFGKKVVFKKLESTVKETKTINGEYKFLGLDEEKRIEFLEEISKISGVDRSMFFSEKSGYSLDHGLSEIIILSIFVMNSLVLSVLFIVITIKHLSKLGKLILQGWSRKHFAMKLYQPFISTAFVSIVLFVLYGFVLTNASFTSVVFISLMICMGLVHFFIIVILLFISSLFIFLISPIDAIRERIPKTKYMVIACIVYVVFNVFLVVGSLYIDSPYKEIQKNIDISKKWQRVSDYKILKSIDVGQDQASFNRQSKELFRNFYHWYKEISEYDDVHIVKTTFISKDMLKSYQKNQVYKTVPNEEFWQLTASPHYLKKLGIKFDDAVTKNARLGVRTYFIPKNKSADEIERLKEMLKERDTKSIREDDIKTLFTESKTFEFLEYSFDKEIFSFSTKTFDELMIRNPVILLVTPENMIYKETESLLAIGLENSYIKLESAAEEKYLTPEYLSKFHLADNHIEFLSIHLFVDGLQKDLWLTVQMYLGFLIVVMCIVVMLLVTIMTIFQNAYKEKISVKKFLGYSNFSIYRIPALFVASVSLIDILIVLFLRTKIGLLFVLSLGLMQLGMFYVVVVRNQMKKLNLFLKS